MCEQGKCLKCEEYKQLAIALRDALFTHLKEKKRILSKGIEYREQELKNIEFQRNNINALCKKVLK